MNRELELCRELARRGNPFPLIAMQWPDMVVTEPEEAKYLGGTADDQLNPCLRLDAFQRQMLNFAFQNDGERVAFVRACINAGKDFTAALAAAVNIDIYPHRCEIVCVGDTRRAADTILMTINGFLERRKYPAVESNHNIHSFSSQDIDSVKDPSLIIFSDIYHIPQMCFWWHVRECRGSAKVFAVSNRLTSWYLNYKRTSERVLDIDIDAYDCVNVTASRKIIPGQITREQVDEIRKNAHEEWQVKAYA